MSWRSRSPEETRALARAMAGALHEVAAEEGWVVSLIGPLGAGKTEFAKGVAEGLGLPAREVTSPTFAIANEWSLPEGGRLVHADFYRLDSARDLEAAGLSDWLEVGTSLLVEWGDRFSEALPGDRLEVELSRDAGDAEARALSARSGGPRSQAALERWSQACS